MGVVHIVLLCLAIIAGTVLALIAVSLIRTLLTKPGVSTYTPAPDPEREKAYAEKLSRMIRKETVSGEGLDTGDKFRAFRQELEDLFPLVHREMKKTEIDGNLLFHWKGKSSGKPIVLMSHQDVVPAEGEWIHPPFSGDIADGKVWGRGASDTKCSVMAFFQAAEELIAEGYVPENDVYLSSSCNEEWNGGGCPKLVEEMKRRGVKPWIVLDEGGGIITEPISGIPGNFAMIGVLEKGIGNVRFTARSEGGHASSPPKNSPIARLAAFVNDVETHKVFRRKMPGAVADMFSTLSRYAAFPLRWIFGNLWLFRPVLLRILPDISPAAGAMIRTTAAFTMQSGSDAFNVLPQEASVCANLRFIPHQGMRESLEILEKRAEKHGVTMEVVKASDAVTPVETKGPEFDFVTGAIGHVFPGCPYSPYVMTGATDARFYQEICSHVYRFAPVIYGPEQMKGMHGMNENIGTACLPGAVDFYKYVITANK